MFFFFWLALALAMALVLALAMALVLALAFVTGDVVGVSCSSVDLDFFVLGVYTAAGRDFFKTVVNFFFCFCKMSLSPPAVFF